MDEYNFEMKGLEGVRDGNGKLNTNINYKFL